jgi:small-conductance mechanosensitive channel
LESLCTQVLTRPCRFSGKLPWATACCQITRQNRQIMTCTLIAGLGVGGIAVALAAQQTIANVLGGVSLVGDQPVRIGEFEKFGDMIGVVEDIGMRSTRIRTLSRTVISVPNSNFAGGDARALV